MWSMFWISTPVFFVLTIYISVFAKMEKKAGVLFNLLCSAFCALLLLMIGLFLYYGPSPDPDPGPKTTLYQHSYLFFMVLSWSVWIGPYALLYGFLKGIFVNFEK